jgi:hypothetical protein
MNVYIYRNRYLYMHIYIHISIHIIHINMNMYIGLSKPIVHTIDDVLQLLFLGLSKRSTASTILNNHSSRSHAVVTLEVSYRFFIVGLFCYIYIFYYLYVDSLMPLADRHFCVGLYFVAPSRCNFLKVNIIIIIQ